MMINKAKTYAVITGASSGLGEKFALKMARHGYKCLLVARREDRLKEICDRLNADERVDADVTYMCADLSTIAGCEKLYKEIEDKRLGVFINNAGFGDFSEFIEGDLDKELMMIDVNVKAVHYLTKKVLQKLQKQGHGYILNVASSAGLFPAGPYMATYYATKSYVASLTRAIARELKEANSSIYVGCLCPGPVDTEFNETAGVGVALNGITAEQCVNEAVKGMYDRKTVIIPSIPMKLACAAAHICPEPILVAITSKQQRKKQGKS